MNVPSGIRINARLTGEGSEHFDGLRKRVRPSASDLLREHRAAHARKRPDAAALLARSGFIGGFEGPEDLSARCEDCLTDAIERKTALRVQDGDDK